MENIINNLNQNKIDISNSESIVYNVLDPMFNFLKDYIIEELRNLNEIRDLYRKGTKENMTIGQLNYSKFRKKRIELIQIFNALKKDFPKLKTLSAANDLITMSSQRKVQTKIPSSPKNYLSTDNINEYDIDWIIQKTKNYFGKLAQTYSSERISYLIKN